MDCFFVSLFMKQKRDKKSRCCCCAAAGWCLLAGGAGRVGTIHLFKSNPKIGISCAVAAVGGVIVAGDGYVGCGLLSRASQTHKSVQ